jgi:adenylosuccinate synthase
LLFDALENVDNNAAGKGKMIDVLSSQAQLCLRAQGGHNAGHTIVTNGVTYDFHLIPSGVLNPKCINLIGSGCKKASLWNFEEFCCLIGE